MNKMRFYILFVLAAIFSFSGKTQPYSYQIALAKYNGGGDWYANLETSLPNLIKFCNKNLNDEAQNIRNYLIGGGFLHISDNYGLDQFIRPQLKKVFPELELVELPYNHPIYHQKYNFNGLPKIHEHDNKPAKGFGLIYEGKLVCFYDFECDLGDGWEDAVIHNNSEENRLKALQMGANIIQYALTQ